MDDFKKWAAETFANPWIVGAVVVAAFLAVGFTTGILQEIARRFVAWLWDKKPTSDIHQLPAPPVDFVGRGRELKQLRKKIRGSNVAITGVRGMAGVGKTAFALKLAAKLAPHYPHARIYLDLQGTTTPLPPARIMEYVILSFHRDARMPEDEQEIAGLYRSVLHGKRALLLMDNALDAAQVAPLAPPAGNLMIVTSRQDFNIIGWFALDLDPLPLDKSVELLLKICPRIDRQAKGIAEACGCLPLALRLAAGALAVRKTLSVEKYVKDLEEERTRIDTLDKYEHLTRPEKTVEASFRQSFDLLSDELPKFWTGLSVFPSDFDSAAAAAVCDTDDKTASDRLGDLLSAHLVEWDKETDRYRLHDLARDFAAARLAEDASDEYEAHKRHAGYYLVILNLTSKLYLKGGENVLNGLGIFDIERTNIETGFDWAAANMESDDDAARMTSAYPGKGVYCRALRQHPRSEGIPWLEKALDAARKLQDKSAEGTHLSNLGTAYADLGDARKAIEYYDQCLVIHREMGNRRGEGAALGNLGLAHFNLGNARKAIEYHEKALAVMEEIGDQRAQGSILGNLGIAYKNLGDARKAIEYHDQCLVIHCEIGDRRGEGQALGNLGLAYAALGDARKAIEYYEKQLVIVREIGDRRGEGNALGSLGIAYADLGDVRKAIEYYEQWLVIHREIGDRRGEGQALGSLGIAYADLGDARKAIEYHEKALAIDRDIGDRRGEGNALWNMALVLDSLDRRAEAIPSAEAALKIYEAIEHPSVSKVRAKLAEWKES